MRTPIYVPEQLLRASRQRARDDLLASIARTQNRAALAHAHAARMARPRRRRRPISSRSRGEPSRFGSRAHCRCSSRTPRCATSRAGPSALARGEVVKISRVRSEVAHDAQHVRRSQQSRDDGARRARETTAVVSLEQRSARIVAAEAHVAAATIAPSSESVRAAAEFAALQPVEQLLERQLRARHDAALQRARHRQCRSPERSPPARAATTAVTPIMNSDAVDRRADERRPRPICCADCARVGSEIGVEPDVRRDCRRPRSPSPRPRTHATTRSRGRRP